MAIGGTLRALRRGMRTVTAAVCACIVLSVLRVSPDARAGSGGTERISLELGAGQLAPSSDLAFVAAPSFIAGGRARLELGRCVGLTGAISRAVLTRGDRIAPVMDLQLGLVMAGLSAQARHGWLVVSAGAELGVASLRVSAPHVPRSHRGLAARTGVGGLVALTESLRVGARFERFHGRVALPERRYFVVAGTVWSGVIEARW